jgi:hypothetical protein
MDGLSILLRTIGHVSEDSDSVILLDSILVVLCFGFKKIEVVDSFNEVRR